ncbi:TOBE domain-containing protein [Solicola gregarius]|uniref:Helix-turn-helix transcriptional regulator n=1 Tax=Solicola gregarius TaxID=2908642 RepID=A0AA46TJ82_9ACTN|nr:TOBE domain-containing protein [Solicola gregarius]UYM06246.1 helix-turn-helix transcriptional regulator [Solicola gregarius]
MPTYRLSEAADLLGVSIDTVRRWADQRRFSPVTTEQGRAAIDGEDLARLAREQAHLPDAGGGSGNASARNRMRGIVTSVTKDTVMAQVEMCCGPYRVVSLLSAEAVDDLGLAPGSVATAVVKATNVVVEVD